MQTSRILRISKTTLRYLISVFTSHAVALPISFWNYPAHFRKTFPTRKQFTSAFSILCSLCFITLFGTENANAEYDGDDPVNLQLPKTTMSDFPGEEIGLPSLNLGLAYQDVLIPGPNDLNLVLRRIYKAKTGVLVDNTTGDGYESNAGFGRFWFLDYPVYTLTDAKPNFPCSGTLNDQEEKQSGVYIPGRGVLQAVGFASANSLPSGTAVAFSDGSVLSCSSNVPTLRTPDGMSYKFGEYIDVFTEIGGFQIYHPAAKRLVTEISDRFDNKITFSYSTIAGEVVLTSLSRNDGASISINYTLTNGEQRISSVTYGSRTIQYTYTASSPVWLQKHIDEEGRETSYQYGVAGIVNALTKITLPTGGIADYTYYPNSSTNQIPIFSLWPKPLYPVLKTKQISGPDITTRNFEFERHQSEYAWGTEPIGGGLYDYGTMYTKVTELDYQGSSDLTTEYRFHRVDGLVGNATPTATNYLNPGFLVGESSLHGQLKSIKQNLGTASVYEEIYDWSFDVAGSVGCLDWWGLGDSSLDNANEGACGRSNLDKITKKVFNVGGTDVYVTRILNYDVYGYPLVTQYRKHTGASRYQQKSYAHNVTHWLLGRPKKEWVSSDNATWDLISRESYYGNNHSYKALPNEHFEYEVLQHQNFAYHTSGELKKRLYNGTSKSEQYEDYKRGTPQKQLVPLRYAGGVRSLTRVVDDYGNVLSENDFTGTVTNYTYDSLNRIKSLSHADPLWTGTSWIYNDTLQTVTETTGNLRQISHLDALGREKLSSVEDIGLPGSRVYERRGYDKKGNLNFESHPASNSTSTNGISRVYDALDRKISESIAELGLNRSWSYRKNHRVHYFNGLGNQTISYYESFGSPDYGSPVQINQPVGVSTTITYNLWGNIQSVSQGGMMETYLYNDKQLLCKTIRPDIGKVGYGYNDRRQVVWQSHGTVGSSTACGGEPDADKITTTYDNRGDWNVQKFSNGVVYREQTLDADGNLVGMDSQSGSWSYTYNSLNLVEKETLGVSGRTFVLDWIYNPQGVVRKLIYPDGQNVDFSPNALGQPLQAGSYVGDATYHPTGKISSYSYANGITRNLVLNALGMPTKISDYVGSSRRFEQDYSYDAEMNLKNLWDLHNNSYSMNNITYDGMLRIKTGSGKWGATTVQYDTLSNITSMKLGSNTTTYNYVSNRLDSTTGAITKAFSYDIRGNVIGNGSNTLTYNEANQLTSASGGHSFMYDGHGRRIEKANPMQTVNSVYGIDGRLYHQKVVGGDSTNYIFLDDTLVAKEVN